MKKIVEAIYVAFKHGEYSRTPFTGVELGAPSDIRSVSLSPRTIREV